MAGIDPGAALRRDDRPILGWSSETGLHELRFSDK
jgi:hypothetical protein